jgi:hypothetical protein
MTEHDPVAAADQRYAEDQARADASKEALFDVCADRVRDGLDTPDTLAARTAFTAVTIRKALRARGVNALPPGPKKTTAGK